MTLRSLDKLHAQIAEIEATIPQFSTTNTSVSSASVGWHLEHSMLVINGIMGIMAQSDPNAFKRKINLKKVVIFAVGKFPIGKAKAPNSVKPEKHIERTQLYEHLQKTRHQVPKLSDLHPKTYFNHPLFGDLDLNDSIRFLELHTEHHLKIIRRLLE